MATRTSIGLVPFVIVVVAAAVFVEPVRDMATGLWSRAVTGESEIIGAGDARIMVASNAAADARRCTPQRIVTEQRCGDLRVLHVDARRMPFIARNTKLAWESGRPAVLTMNRAKARANRGISCPGTFLKRHGGQCDEYPMAVTEEGGRGARADEVPERENQCQGGSYVRQYPKDGDRFLVVIIYPDRVASGPFVGLDIAVDQSVC